MIITSLTIAFIVVAGLSMTFVAMRLVEQHGQPSMSSPDLVRPIMIVDALVLAPGIVGIIDASATRRPSMP